MYQLGWSGLYLSAILTRTPANKYGVLKMIRQADTDITMKESHASPSAAVTGIPFSSNLLYLSGREWIVAGVIIFILSFLIPSVWEQSEKFRPGGNYRIPYTLSNDYWLYQRWARRSACKYDTLVIGDSFIWGHYVKARDTLTGHLNDYFDGKQFANLGVDGIHPAALAGLIKYYGRDITGKNVILHLNPIWMSSLKHDLQSEKEFHFNHPGLVPQFFPKIPCYRETASNKIGIVLERKIPLFSWAAHLRQVYFDNLEPAGWCLEHPNENPLGVFKFKPAGSDEERSYEQRTWRERGMTRQDFGWVDPASSLQWKFFRQTVELLRKRGNNVFVMVGPINEHMMEESSLAAYKNIKSGLEEWFQQNNIDYYIPPVLPGELYADASHPLSKGYALLARWLLRNKLFQYSILPVEDETNPQKQQSGLDVPSPDEIPLMDSICKGQVSYGYIDAPAVSRGLR